MNLSEVGIKLETIHVFVNELCFYGYAYNVDEERLVLSLNGIRRWI